ncbi:MAG: M20/M25/M40 family metallo-hydrolase [Verrucomicrobiota bacterium JB022]|nr:M20/M25/M40 family metallo-hydrolase [Verrucomicrobiota bacterium JB022]
MDPLLNDVLSRVDDYRLRLSALREIILANTVMCGEISSPTFREERLVRFLNDRFTESGLQNIGTDEAGNAVAMLPGTEGKHNILIAAHTDKIWEEGVDHTVSVSGDRLTGAGVADNSLGVATMISVPDMLERLGIKLKSNLILLGASRSMGRGDLGGLRFFLENTQRAPSAAVCLEGVQLGRLSYSSLGMERGELVVESHEDKTLSTRWGSTGAIVVMNRVVRQILEIRTPEEPKTSIILGSVRAGSAYNTPPQRATLRFEIRSEAPGMVNEISDRIREIVEEVNAEDQTTAHYTIVARRKPGTIGFGHRYTAAARKIMEALDVKPKAAPSISELSTLLDHNVPSLTLGLTYGDNKHEQNETIYIEPIFRGLAQLVALLEVIDGDLQDEQ